MGRYKQNYTLFKRGNYWYYRTYDRSGVRTSAKTTGCKLKSEAKIYCDKLYKQGNLWSPSIFFKEYADHFFDEDSTYVRDRVVPMSPQSLRNYRSRLNKELLPVFGNEKLSDITLSKIKQFRINLMDAGYSVCTINGIMMILKIIIDSAFRDQLISDNPFKYITTLQNINKSRGAFSLSEIKELLAYLPEDRETILLLALTGMRQNEAAGVTVEDVKTKDNNIYIDLTKQFYGGEYHPLKTKTARAIPICSEVQSIIGQRPKKLFTLSRLITANRTKFENGEERSLCMHSLRHFFITQAKADGVNPLIVEAIAGHSLKGIQQVYTNFNLDNLAEIVEWQRKTYYKLTEN